MALEFQIAGNLTRSEAKKLNSYAKGLELSRANLCALLVVRELASLRVARLQLSYAGSEPKKGSSRVTARVSRKTKARFDKWVAKSGVASGDAAAVLFRAELEEKWLRKALRLTASGFASDPIRLNGQLSSAGASG